MKEVIYTPLAPAAIGPYSQAIKAGNTIYTSGQIGLVPATGEFAGETVEAQAIQALENLTQVLGAAGASLEDAVKVTVFLKDMGDFAAVNQIYAQYFKGDCPARSAVAIAALPKGALVEIEVIACIG